MKRLKRIINLMIILILLVTQCLSNISTSAYEDDTSIYVNTGNYTFCIDKFPMDTSIPETAIIVDIKKGTKVFNVPETVVYNNKTYPVTDIIISDDLYDISHFTKTLETINVGKNTGLISFDSYIDLKALKSINIPLKSELTNISLPRCPKLKNINLSKDSVLETILISSCPKLKKLSLPKTLQRCDIGCDAPKMKVKIAMGNKHLKVKGNQILSKDGKTLVDIVGKDSCVKTYKTVKKFEFIGIDNKYLKKLIIGKNVTELNDGFAFCKKLKTIVIKNKKKAPKVHKYSFEFYKKSISFYVQNKKVAKSLKKQLKGSRIKNAKILIGKKVVYQNING